MRGRGVFITGTDTEVGKTVVSCALLHACRRAGVRAVGFKPVAAGARRTPQGLRNEDAEQLAAASAFQPPYHHLNPYCLEPAIAPHIAAAEVGVTLDFAPIEAAYAALAATAELVVVEGAGGWRVPLGPDGDMADLAVRLGLPVVLVVGMRLGCLNHALLSAEAIRARGLPLLGWVANTPGVPMERLADNLKTLEREMQTEKLGEMPAVTEPYSLDNAWFMTGIEQILLALDPQ